MPVAEARLGNRAEACDGAAAGKRGDLYLGCMGRMDQAPAPIDGRMFEQPLDRPPARPGDAFLNFPDLFGGVNMNRPAFGEWYDCRQFVRGHGSQAVRGDTDIGPGQFADGICVGPSLGNWSTRDEPALTACCGRHQRLARRNRQHVMRCVSSAVAQFASPSRRACIGPIVVVMDNLIPRRACTLLEHIGIGSVATALTSGSIPARANMSRAPSERIACAARFRRRPAAR